MISVVSKQGFQCKNKVLLG